MPDVHARIAPHTATILDRLAEAVTVQAADGQIVYANQAAARLLGFDSPEEMIATPPGAIVARYEMRDEDGRPLSRDRLPGRRALAGEEPEPLLLQYVDRDTGTTRWTIAKASAIRDGTTGERLAVNIIEDVTGVVQAEHEQRLLAELSKRAASSLDPEQTVRNIVDALVPAVAAHAEVRLADGRGGTRSAAAAGVQAGDATHVPLVARGEATGTLVLSPPVERSLAAEIGRRAGTALDNADQHASRTHIATTLQRSLLPPRLPYVPGMTLAARFRAAEEGSEVGGDFYDVFEVDDAWWVVMGDVTGKGPAAAAVTGLARYTLRTAAAYEERPSAALDRLNATLYAESRLCSAVCARLVPDAGGWQMTVACAGHPPPLLMRHGAAPRPVGRPGTLGGAFARGAWPEDTTGLAARDRLLFYTDGVTDNRGDGGRYGIERFVTLVESLDGAPPQELTERIEDALQSFQVGPQPDDVALLAIEVG